MNWRKDLEGNYNKKPLIVLTGPTAVGKTELSVKLAAMINGEIISADSMQVYKYMDIGTAKVSKEEMRGVPHHMIDILEPQEDFNVTVFKQKAKECIADIVSRNKIPIIAGGTGFYIQAVLNDIDFTEHESDDSLRTELSEYAETYGNEALYKKLQMLDPDAAKKIHPNNVKRVIRAIEYCTVTGELFSVHNAKESEKISPYNYSYFVLNRERNKLYERIDKRVDIMLEQGLVSEVQKLIASGCTRNMISMQGLGYKEVIDYLEGKCSYEDMIYIIKRETRHFAKRQLTWFKREKDVIWLDKDSCTDDKLLSDIKEIIKDKGIL